ncbi:MAG: glycosyltransferase family 4 protein [Anaerolineae bacterium]|nr:glycosyltransferase family 4 protein [Anaerolineae bacterium]
MSNLARALIPQLAPTEWLTLLYNPAHTLSVPEHNRVRLLPVAASPFSLKQQWIVPRLLRELKAGLYHSAYYLMPYYPGVPTVLTLYDVTPIQFPEHSTRRARWFFRCVTLLALRAAYHSLVISKATQQDFAAYFHVPAERLTAIPLAADPVFHLQSPEMTTKVRAKYNLPEHFILYLGSNKPHKNLVRLVEAMAKVWENGERREWRSGEKASAERVNPELRIQNLKSDIPLVIAGAWYEAFPEARLRADVLEIGKRVRWLGPVPGADLPALYAAASLFVFPSLYEGFGLPVIEAMACGTPVACAETSSLPEVAGDAALLFDPTDVDAIAAALHVIITDVSLRADLRARGLQQAAQFSWERTARETLDVYRAVK